MLKFWRYWLLSFDEKEFGYFKEICKGRFDVETMAEAVSVVVANRAR